MQPLTSISLKHILTLSLVVLEHWTTTLTISFLPSIETHGRASMPVFSRWSRNLFSKALNGSVLLKSLAEEGTSSVCFKQIFRLSKAEEVGLKQKGVLGLVRSEPFGLIQVGLPPVQATLLMTRVDSRRGVGGGRGIIVLSARAFRAVNQWFNVGHNDQKNLVEPPVKP
jgi:hypothetical protein